jgi:hypothetical protein
MPEDKNFFLSDYNDSDINCIPFTMKPKTDIDYTTVALNKYIIKNRP